MPFFKYFIVSFMITCRLSHHLQDQVYRLNFGAGGFPYAAPTPTIHKIKCLSLISDQPGNSHSYQQPILAWQEGLCHSLLCRCPKMTRRATTPLTMSISHFSVTRRTAFLLAISISHVGITRRAVPLIAMLTIHFDVTRRGLSLLATSEDWQGA